MARIFPANYRARRCVASGAFDRMHVCGATTLAARAGFRVLRAASQRSVERLEVRRIYLDWNATAPMLPQARDAMIDALATVHGNASSVHHEGQVARTVVERARRALAEAVGARAQSVVLTGGATESNNQVLRHHIQAHAQPSLISSAVEHPSVLEVVRELGEGVPWAVWPVDKKGRLRSEERRVGKECRSSCGPYDVLI